MSLLTNTTDTVSGSSQDPEVTEMASGTDSDTIRDICSYHRSKYYFPLVQNNFGQVPSALSTSFKAPTSDLGDLSVLPEEVLAMIALNLDIDSFRHFRQVNRQARFIATAIPQYQQVLQHGLEGVNALLRTGLSHAFSYDDLYKTLISPSCELCGEFGGFLFLLTCTRCCYNCFRTAPQMGVLDKCYIQHEYPQDLLFQDRYQPSELAAVLKSSNIRSFKVHDWHRPEKMNKGMVGVLTSDLFDAYLEVSNISELFTCFYEENWLHYRSAACTAYPWLNKQSSKVERGVSCKGCYEVYLRGIFAPTREKWNYPDVPSGCGDRDRSYSEKGFQNHFASCEYAQRIWQDSENGKRVVSDLVGRTESSP